MLNMAIMAYRKKRWRSIQEAWLFGGVSLVHDNLREKHCFLEMGMLLKCFQSFKLCLKLSFENNLTTIPHNIIHSFKASYKVIRKCRFYGLKFIWVEFYMGVR